MSELTQASIHSLQPARTAGTPSDTEALSPKQQMLDTVDTLRARIEADFVTGIQIFAGTRLGEPVDDQAVGSFAQSPLDMALLVSHCLYRRLYALKEAELANKSALAARMLGSGAS